MPGSGGGVDEGSHKYRSWWGGQRRMDGSVAQRRGTGHEIPFRKEADAYHLFWWKIECWASPCFPCLLGGRWFINHVHVRCRTRENRFKHVLTSNSKKPWFKEWFSRNSLSFSVARGDFGRPWALPGLGARGLWLLGLASAGATGAGDAS